MCPSRVPGVLSGAGRTYAARSPRRRRPRRRRAPNRVPGVERRASPTGGPSPVFRAFYGLPESIATPTGAPTNAIFGFASILVKIVTDYGVQPTVVAWDAGSSGRTELFADYKAGRRSRP